MKLQKTHLHALDIGIHKVLQARDQSNNPEEALMLTKNANRLRQLRILMIECLINPVFNFSELFYHELPEKSNLAKGIRMLTGHPE